ncbi:leucine--tRNA ligase [Frankia sp. CiP3]|uniref:leucine--tRNA ligase n=1 Tax=Frankia sp. CiP3 TaxID=2880971 RepID=UPI001EF63CC4|nr:leucine--tRNA ligase [Frankia sp. CiP3]
MDAPDFREIDKKWQDIWHRERTWQVSNNLTESSGAAYVLEMLPYTSGEPHIGHLKNYAVGDAVAHFMRRNGRRVLHPMGYDAFGLPAENHAIRTGKHPKESTDESIASFARQFREWGISIDWSRELATHQPSYYRWTQWIFLRLFEKGLAYRKNAAVKWCPKDATVLANEQVVGGRCERCGTEVEARQLEQWFFRITDYADRLLAGLHEIEWPEHVKTMQRNWIGRSEGAEVIFPCVETGEQYHVFTTRPDTLFGATFFVLAPEHPDVLRLAAGTPQEESVREYVNQALRSTNDTRGAADKPKTGVFLGRHVINPANNEHIPVYVADYVLMEYGTGAVMAVPAHDERDYAFAREFGLPITPVIAPDDPDGPAAGQLPYTGAGTLRSSGEFDGLTSAAAGAAITSWLAAEGAGCQTVSYKLRDWLVSRQRYWGCPIPIIHCQSCGLVPVPDEQLPVRLPDVEDYAPKGRSPLASADDWVNVTCPACGGYARRETDTMDTFVDSSWYFLRYCDPTNTEQAWDFNALAEWMPVDQYIGGIEHAILHLLYARFLTKVLYDLGKVPVAEPFAKLFTQGMITKDGAKMSKSRGNVVSPVRIVKHYGADTARCYVLFMGPPDTGADWSDEGIEGVYRFLRRLLRLGRELAETDQAPAAGDAHQIDTGLNRKVAETIVRVTESMTQKFAFNISIAAIMELSNSVSRAQRDGASPAALRHAVATGASLLFPFAPHISSEVYELLTGRRVWEDSWPLADMTLLASATKLIVCQVNGKVRDRVEVPAGADDAVVESAARASQAMLHALSGSTLLKTVVVRDKLINFVVR